MPDISPAPMPTVTHSNPTATKKEKVTGFHKDPVESISRPVNTSESWACYHFEMHARKCAYCHNPYEVYRNREKLCDVGHRLAQELIRYVYNKADGNTYSTVEEDGKPIRIEIPVGYVETSSLLKAVERTLHHRSREAFVSMDRKHHAAPLSSKPPQKSRSVKVEMEVAGQRRKRPRSGEVVDWPESSSGNFKRDSLYEEDLARSRRNAKHYAVEVREPTLRDLREHRSSGYYRGSLPVESSDPNEGQHVTPENDVSEVKPATSDAEILAKIPWGYDSDDDILENPRESKNPCRSIQTPLKDHMDVDEADISSDAGSVFSVTSLASSATAISKGSGFSPVQIATATLELLAVFQDDEVLQPLYTTAIHGNIGPQKFKKKFRRLLKTYSENLKEEASEHIDLLAARLVAYRANHIAVAITERYQTSLAPMLPDDESLRAKTANEHEQYDDEQEEDEQPEAGVDESVFEKLTKNHIREFLVGSAALEQLRTSLQCFVFPSKPNLKDEAAEILGVDMELDLSQLSQNLQEVVLSTPRDMLRISSENIPSYVNKLKAVTEEYTRLEWDWWPMSPRIPDVKPGQFRLEWVFCGVQFFELISSSECKALAAIIPLMPLHPKYCYCCNHEGHRVSWRDVQKRIVRSNSNVGYKQNNGTSSSKPGQSKASERYTPPVSALTPGPQATSTAGPEKQSHGTNNASSPQIQNEVPKVQSNEKHVSPQRILFAIQGSRWSLDLEQILVSNIPNDPVFFRELKTLYKKHRSWIKRTISPFRFRFCNFVKFEKVDAERILSQGKDLPEYPGVEHDYEYAPRPGTNPMINPKTFAVCLQTCNENCKWPLINPWHDCIRLPCRSYRLRCIPKKKSEFDLQSDDIGTVAWGLEADYAMSFAFVAFYHLVPLLAALGFWIYWLLKFPGDWQNAAVPVLTVLALFAVLWVPFAKHVGAVDSNHISGGMYMDTTGPPPSAASSYDSGAQHGRPVYPPPIDEHLSSLTSFNPSVHARRSATPVIVLEPTWEQQREHRRSGYYR